MKPHSPLSYFFLIHSYCICLFSQILHQYCGSRFQRPHLPRPESGLCFWKFLTQVDRGCAVLKERAGMVRTLEACAVRDQPKLAVSRTDGLLPKRVSGLRYGKHPSPGKAKPREVYVHYAPGKKGHLQIRSTCSFPYGNLCQNVTSHPRQLSLCFPVLRRLLE